MSSPGLAPESRDTCCGFLWLLACLSLGACADDAPARGSDGTSELPATDDNEADADAGERSERDAAAADAESDVDRDDAGEREADAGPQNDAAIFAPACGQPYDVGVCNAAFQVYGYDPSLKACVPKVYGGCGGNDNRFDTLKACEAACPSAAKPSQCAAGTALREICVQCGLAGGCAESVTACAKKCSAPADCDAFSNDYLCADGVCQVSFCI